MDSYDGSSKRFSIQSFHEGFVELEELVSSDNELVWKERARWIKLEEDVEESANRWGKPHIPCLTFRSLREVETNLQNGIILLDLQSSSLSSICDAIINEIKLLKKLPDEECDAVKALLLTRHEHQYQQRKSRTNAFARRLSRIMPQGQRPRPPSIGHKGHLSSVMEKDSSSESKNESESDSM